MDSLNTVDYNRQTALDETLSLSDGVKDHTLITIIGCGGIGFWVGLFYAMMGFKHFLLIDGETLDSSNIARIPVPQTWVGRNKTVALRKTIHTLRPDTTVRVVPTHYTDSTAPDILDIIEKTRSSGVYVFDTTDDARTQKKTYNFFKGSAYAKYLKIGYEGFKIGNYRNMDVWINEDTYQTGYRTSMANVITSAISAGIGIFANSIRDIDENGRVPDTADFNLNLFNLIIGDSHG